MTAKKILIVSGEPSGDLHASNLVRDLKTLEPNLSFYGIGGDLSRRAGVDVVFDITKLALVGATEVIKHIFVVKKAHDTLIARVERERPDIAILVDYPGFNLALAKSLCKRGIPVIYYISPQVWAWGRQRIRLIKKYIKKMIVLFGFEEELYKKYGIDAVCVGHPLVDVVKLSLSKDQVFKKYGLTKDKKVITILPGSREFEITTFLPIISEAAQLIDRKIGPVQFLISKHPDKPASIYEGSLRNRRFDYRVVEGDMHNIAGASDFVIAASGTATLETAMLGTPLVIVYKTSLITYILYKIVRDIPFLGLANIIAKKEIAPEILQHKMTPERIANAVVSALSDPSGIERTRTELAAVKDSLGPGGASMRAAEVILPYLR